MNDSDDSEMYITVSITLWTFNHASSVGNTCEFEWCLAAVASALPACLVGKQDLWNHILQISKGMQLPKIIRSFFLFDHGTLQQESAQFVLLSGRCKDSSRCLAHWPSWHGKDFDGQGSGRCYGWWFFQHCHVQKVRRQTWSDLMFYHVPPLEPPQTWLTVMEAEGDRGFIWFYHVLSSPQLLQNTT